MKQAVNWVCTLNNPTVDPKEFLEQWVLHGKARYVTGQLEKGLEGTIHIQYFLNFRKPGATIGGLKKFCNRSHFEQIKWDNGAAKYCNKEETRVEGPWSFGEKPTENQNKNDWALIKEQAIAGKLLEITPNIYVQHYGNLKRIELDNIKTVSRTYPRKCYWYWGKSGAGKTRRAVAEYPDAYMKMCNEWWCSYNNEPVVIIDDWDQSLKGLTKDLKQWADPWGKVPGNKKHGKCPLPYDILIVTS